MRHGGRSVEGDNDWTQNRRLLNSVSLVTLLSTLTTLLGPTLLAGPRQNCLAALGALEGVRLS